MALITCPECKKEVSDQAQVCPNCACPIKQVRVRAYSNRFTFQQVLATIIFFIGIFILLPNANSNSGAATIGILMMFVSLAWLGIIRLLIWFKKK